jgi:hypothetical protein
MCRSVNEARFRICPNKFGCIEFPLIQRCYGAGIAQSVYRLATGWTIRRSNSGRGEIFRIRPDRPWGPPSLLYNGCQFSFSQVKRPGRGVDHPPPSSAEVEGRIRAIPLLHLRAFVACSRETFTFLQKCYIIPSRTML